MLGMVSGLDRKNCWTIAEHRGDRSPDGLQHLLSRAKWDADAVRDDLRDYVVDAFGDPGAVLVVDETGDVKKGTATVGVQRQYTGTAGRIENAQVAVYLTYAAPRGHALIDRALYLPKSWAEDPDRCEEAGIPTDRRGFATKPALAKMLISPRGRRQGARSVGGRRRGLRRRPDDCARPIRGHGLGYVLAVSANRRVPTAGRPDPRRCAPRAAARAGLAETLRRRRQPRTPPLLLGLDRAAAPRTTPTPAITIC